MLLLYFSHPFDMSVVSMYRRSIVKHVGAPYVAPSTEVLFITRHHNEEVDSKYVATFVQHPTAGLLKGCRLFWKRITTTFIGTYFLMSPYSAYSNPFTDILKLCLTTTIPKTSIPIIFVLHALRLSLAYQASARKSTSWIQGLLSVIALPMSGGLVATVMTGSIPPFLQSDIVIPTYMATYLVVHNSAFVRTFFGSMPTGLVDLLTMPADAILKASNICLVGVDGITGHYSATVKHNWFAPLWVGGSVGSAGYLSMKSFNLFSPVWTLSTRFDAVEWDLYGPFVLSFLYLALQGSNAQINGMIWNMSQGVFGGKRARYFTKREAQVLITMAQMAVQSLKLTGIWSGKMPGGFDRIAATTRYTPVAQRLGGAEKKKDL